MATLAERVNNFLESWRYEPGDRLIGEIIDLTPTEGLYGDYLIIGVLVEEEGSTEAGGAPVSVGAERGWHAFDKVPARELKKLAPRLGDRIAAKYFGKRPNRD